MTPEERFEAWQTARLYPKNPQRTAYVAGYHAGAEDMRERAVKCAAQQTGGFSACIVATGEPLDDGNEYAIRDKDGPWILTSTTETAIRALPLPTAREASE